MFLAKYLNPISLLLHIFDLFYTHALSVQVCLILISSNKSKYVCKNAIQGVHKTFRQFKKFFAKAVEEISCID